jgi:cytochrome c oxidase subunit 2
VARLFWVMAAGAAVIWAVVFGAAVWAALARRPHSSERTADLVILGGGVIFPTVTLGALLVYGLALLPDWGPAAAPDLTVRVHAEQYWWRVTYAGPGGTTVETANEVVLPVGATVDLLLTSPDVIHSFWIPPLGGKMDLIPGRENRLRLRPGATGTYGGICAEFCGDGHAFMAFEARVVPRPAFDAWLAAQARPAAAPAGGGAAAFRAAGCAACHRVRGVVEQGAVGPDLTHLASRSAIAGIADTTPAALRAWIRDPQALKPDARMPAYPMLPEAELAAIVTFLEALE